MTADAGVIVQARMGSSRLPGKVLEPVAGKPLILHVLERADRTPGVETTVMATSTEPEETPLVETVERAGFPIRRGPESDVLERYSEVVRTWDKTWIVRVTGDNPLVDPTILGRLLDQAREENADYVAPRGLPIGLYGEILKVGALLDAAEYATDAEDREHVTMYIKKNPDDFRIATLQAPRELARPYRLTVDEEADLTLVRRVVRDLGPDCSARDVVDHLDAHPELVRINADVRQAVPFWPGGASR